MRIGINALALLPRVVGGGETYIRGLLIGLEQLNTGDEYLIFTNRDNHDTFADLGDNFRRVRFNASARWDVRSLFLTRVIGEQLWLPRAALHQRVDAIHSPFDTIPLRARCATVMTLHDLNFEAFPEAGNRAQRKMARALVLASTRRASAIITVSEFCHKAILDSLNVAPERLFMVHNGGPVPVPAENGNWSIQAARMGIEGPYVLALSSVNPHKNLDTLLRAFRGVCGADDCQLVIVGHLPRIGRSLLELSHSLGLGRKVIFTGYLDDDSLRQAMRHARLFAFPSLYEGFGLPVIEAMAHGIPVVCSNAAALPEIAADSALFVDPLSTSQLTSAIERTLADEALRRHLSAAGRRNARRFSWERTAMFTSGVYRYAVEVRRSGARRFNGDVNATRTDKSEIAGATCGGQ